MLFNFLLICSENVFSALFWCCLSVSTPKQSKKCVFTRQKIKNHKNNPYLTKCIMKSIRPQLKTVEDIAKSLKFSAHKSIACPFSWKTIL